MEENQQRLLALGRPGLVTTLRTASPQPQKNRKLLLITVSLLVGTLLLLLGWSIPFQFTEQHTRTSTQTVHPIVMVPPLITTDPHTLYIQATNRIPIFTDSLQIQAAARWQPANTTGMCYLTAKTLHIYKSDGIFAALCLAETTKLTNFAFQAQVSMSLGDTAGLIFRADSLGRKQYLFGITTSGVYTLALTNEPNDLQTHIITGGISSMINQGLNQSNQLTMIARNATLYLYINGQFVTQVNDGSYSSGTIGLFSADSYGNIVESAFNNIRVWSV